jgi:hypothetical protein
LRAPHSLASADITVKIVVPISGSLLSRAVGEGALVMIRSIAGCAGLAPERGVSAHFQIRGISSPFFRGHVCKPSRIGL